MKAVLWGIKLKPHVARTWYTVRVPTGPRRQIHDSARLSQSITSSRQTGAISGGEGVENLPQTTVMKCPIAILSPKIKGPYSTYRQPQNKTRHLIYTVWQCVCWWCVDVFFTLLYVTVQYLDKDKVWNGYIKRTYNDRKGLCTTQQWEVILGQGSLWHKCRVRQAIGSTGRNPGGSITIMV